MKYQILIVDDREEDIFFFKKALYETGLEIDFSSAKDGLAGLDLIRQKNFDCVFMDYNMPGADGMVVLQKIREVNTLLPVIMLTGQKNENVIVKLMKSGATDYLSKDKLSPESLRVSIENARKLFEMLQSKRMADAALVQSERRLAEAQKIAHIGNWEYDFQTKSFWLSDEAIRIVEAYQNHEHPLLHFCRHLHALDYGLFKAALSQYSKNQSIDLTLRFFSWTKDEKCLNLKGNLLGNKAVGTIQDASLMKKTLLEMQRASVRSKATRIVLTIAILIFLLSEAVLDPFIDSLTASLLISLSCKGGIAVALKPIESLLEKIMMKRIALS